MRKVCKTCRIFVEGPTCPLCKGNQFSESWKGRIFVSNSEKSEVAQKVEIKAKGEYAIKVK
ncbi:DNA-directed RNA polymerase subunit E'' [Candidatus Woesearchaeota archaeon]|jgi:DNA-directed RNA polymerase subunit E"|nr:DNA-directed RNA polymerase subunit E'' [Candidatus Woesearchaeota archaeon]MBT6045093.1 DNA-directed RNA polymerase subunit E'' [Candidatus Woesearchaeota archaeon]